MKTEYYQLNPALQGRPNDVMMALIRAGRSLGIEEICTATGIDQSSLDAALKTLRRFGLVQRLADSPRWSVSPELQEAWQYLLDFHGPETDFGKALRGEK